MSITSTGLGDDERKGGGRGGLAPRWDDRDAFSVEEAGEILGLSRGSAFNAANNGDLPTIRIGRRLIVPRRALERLLGIEQVSAVTSEPAQVVAALPAPAPQRVEVAISVLPPERRQRRSHKPAATTAPMAPAPAPAAVEVMPPQPASGEQ